MQNREKSRATETVLIPRPMHVTRHVFVCVKLGSVRALREGEVWSCSHSEVDDDGTPCLLLHRARSSSPQDELSIEPRVGAVRRRRIQRSGRREEGKVGSGAETSTAERPSQQCFCRPPPCPLDLLPPTSGGDLRRNRSLYVNQGERLVATPGETTPDGFHIVGVGASAGGLAATTELLRNLGPEPGVAIVIVHQPEENSPSVKRVAAIRLDPEMLTETPGGRGAALSGGSGRIVIWGTMTLTDNDDWRIKTFFEYWRKRLAFIQALPNESYHEANVLVWAALDALSNLWAARVGKTQAGNRKERNQQRHDPHADDQHALPHARQNILCRYSG